jgi:hypothetical protein
MNIAPGKEIESDALMEFCRRITSMQAGAMIDI